MASQTQFFRNHIHIDLKNGITNEGERKLRVEIDVKFLMKGRREEEGKQGSSELGY